MLVVVGRIGRAHGVRGAVTIEVRTDEPERRFAVGSRLLTDEGRELVVSSSTWHSGRLVVTFEGLEDRSAVEALRNQLLSVDRPDEETPEDPEEYYDSALLGCEVLTVDGGVIGNVSQVSHLPAQDILVVTTMDGREVLVPFVGEFVPNVDITRKRIVISPPAGLLDVES